MTLRVLILWVVVLFPTVMACGGDPDAVSDTPRVVTREDAAHLGRFRSTMYRTGEVAFSGVVASGDQSIFLEGRLDTVDHDGQALVIPRGEADSPSFLAVWNPAEVQAQTWAAGFPSEHDMPQAEWETMPLDPGASHLAAAQLLLLNLSSPNPENALLLAQDGAMWLREDVIDDTPVTVYAGPPNPATGESGLRYWLDEDSRLLRLDARLDGMQFSTFNFDFTGG